VQRDRDRQRDIRAVDLHRELAARAESAGDLDEALRATDAALAEAARRGMGAPADLVRIRGERVRRRARGELDAVASLNPEQAVARMAALAEAAGSDPDLAALRSEIARTLTRAAESRYDGLLAEITNLRRAGPPAVMLDRAARLAALAAHLDPDRAAAARDRAEQLALEVARAAGMVIPPIRGRFQLGTPAAYEAALRDTLAAHATSRGYIVPDRAGPWAEVWPERAPYRLELGVAEESQPYPQTALSATRVDIELILARDGATVWQTRSRSQTRVPPPGMPALEASRLATASSHDPAAERRLYQDAFTQVPQRLATVLPGLPGPPWPPP
jgi:hypothetical protein